METENKKDTRSRGGLPRVLLLGYNGANNTGSEARLLAILDDLRAVFGPEVPITVPTLNAENLRRYLKESSTVRIAPIPSIYFAALRRLARGHDLLLLVEGSCYMDGWTSALLYAFLWGTRCACSIGIPTVAYAVDAGELSHFNRRLVRREASRTSLLICRAQAAAGRLRSWGVTAPLEVTADCAFRFLPRPEDRGFLAREWPQAAGGALGLAVVDFHLWPVRVRPWGRRRYCYRWPYYFSRSKKRRKASEALAGELAELADWLESSWNRPVALIAMEELDEPLAQEVRRRLRRPGSARIFSAAACNASQMTCLLRDLSLLVTSRYHAAVLALEAAVPMLGFGHDQRLRSLFEELGLGEEAFVDSRRPDRLEQLKSKLETMAKDPQAMRERLRQGFRIQAARAARNVELLRELARGRGMEVLP